MIRRTRRGATLIEAVLALGLAGILLAVFVLMAGDHSERQRTGATAERLVQVKSAAEAYMKANTARLLELAASGPVSIGVAKLAPGGTSPDGPASDLPGLQSGGFLPSAFVDTNPYGQRHSMVVRKVTGADRLEAVVSTVGGNAIPDRILGAIAAEVGAEGGFVPTGGVPRMVGTSGGWAAPAAAWAAGGVQPTPGHVVAAIALDEGVVVGDFVNRRNVGVPEAATMRTNLSMGGNTVTDAASVSNGAATVVLDPEGRTTVGTDLRVEGTARATGDVDAVRDMQGARFVDPDKGGMYLSDPNGKQNFFDFSSTNFDTDMEAYGTSMKASPDGTGIEAGSSKKKLGSYLKHEVAMVRAFGGAGAEATALCDKDWVRISCSGARTTPLVDTCSEEDCGFVGALPVEKDGLQGCQTMISPSTGTNPVAVAFCMSNVEGGTGAPRPGVGGTGDAPKPEVCPPWAPGTFPDCRPVPKCPEWAPGAYPACVYDPPEEKCPDWAPGIYPKCIVAKCPPFAPGTYPACNPTPPCTTPWGSTVQHGGSVTAWQASVVPFGSSCVSETRQCLRGRLSGSFLNQSCTVTPPARCNLPWGGSIAHGQSTTGWLQPSVPFGSSCSGQTRTCNDGVLSGSYANGSCYVQDGARCNLPWGGSIAHNTSTTGWLQPSVPYGSSCQPENRHCWNGSLSGSYSNGSCSVQPGAGCYLPWGGYIGHGQSAYAYASPSVGYGGSCSGQWRTCTNGYLSGSYGYQSCSAPACAPNYGQACVSGNSWWDTRPEPCSNPHHCTLFPAGYYDGRVVQCFPSPVVPGWQQIMCSVKWNSRYNCQGSCVPPNEVLVPNY